MYRMQRAHCTLHTSHMRHGWVSRCARIHPFCIPPSASCSLVPGRLELVTCNEPPCLCSMWHPTDLQVVWPFLPFFGTSVDLHHLCHHRVPCSKFGIQLHTKSYHPPLHIFLSTHPKTRQDYEPCTTRSTVRGGTQVISRRVKLPLVLAAFLLACGVTNCTARQRLSGAFLLTIIQDNAGQSQSTPKRHSCRDCELHPSPPLTYSPSKAIS